MNITVRLTKKETSLIKSVSEKLGYSISDYARRKLFDENEDMIDSNDKYVSPYSDKHNLLSVTILCKTLYMVKEILKNQGISMEQVIEADQKSLEYARQERNIHGYKVIKAEDE